MKISTFENGPFLVNTYLLINEETSEAIIIDPGSNLDPMINSIKENNIDVKAILATHSHIDHISGVPIIKKIFNIPLYLNALEKEILEFAPAQARMFGVPDPGTITIDNYIPSDGTISLAGLTFKLFHTPGHSPGSISFYYEPDAVIFSGDTLFSLSIGRTDFPGCNYDDLIHAIKNKLFALPDETKVFPGHGPATTIGIEKKMNPFLR